MTQVIKKESDVPFVRLDKILPAINAAMKAVKKIAKTNENKHDKYDFASIDDFLEVSNSICAENGLIIPPPQEVEIQEFTKKSKYGESSWLRFIFEITLYHTSGQSMPPVRKSVEVMRSGAQASGGAQSYALKQYMRALFQIPTGDKDDPDFQSTDDGVVSDGGRIPAKAGASKNPATRALYTELQQEIDACDKDLDALTILAESGDFKHKIKELPADWQDSIKQRGADAKIAALNAITGEAA